LFHIQFDCACAGWFFLNIFFCFRFSLDVYSVKCELCVKVKTYNLIENFLAFLFFYIFSFVKIEFLINSMQESRRDTMHQELLLTVIWKTLSLLGNIARCN
jgi:hypothetical protein